MSYTGAEDELTPNEYKRALCIRLGTLHCAREYPLRCDCDAWILDDASFIEHALSCQTGKMTSGTGVSYTSRHDGVKNEALVAVPRAYGIVATPEPDTYNMYYEDDTERRRPDVEYHCYKHLAIDLSIVKPGDTPGDRAQEIANVKVKAHRKAVEKVGHVFAPFIIETTGYLHPDALEVINILGNQLHSWMKPFFRMSMLRSLSVSLQRHKTMAITVALQKYRHVTAATPADAP